MEQNPSWEANWSAASQEIPRILWNPKVHHRTQIKITNEIISISIQPCIHVTTHIYIQPVKLKPRAFSDYCSVRNYINPGIWHCVCGLMVLDVLKEHSALQGSRSPKSPWKPYILHSKLSLIYDYNARDAAYVFYVTWWWADRFKTIAVAQVGTISLVEKCPANAVFVWPVS